MVYKYAFLSFGKSLMAFFLCLHRSDPAFFGPTDSPRWSWSIAHMGVSKNRVLSPKSSILIGFSMIFTIHFGGFPPFFGDTHICFIYEIKSFFIFQLAKDSTWFGIFPVQRIEMNPMSNDSKVNFLFRLQYYNFRYKSSGVERCLKKQEHTRQ